MLRRFLLPALFAAGATFALPALPALAAWPATPMRLIVPSAPGGAPDALMRTSQRLGAFSLRETTRRRLA